MSPHDEREPSLRLVYETITKEVLKDDEFKANLGRYTVIFITSAIAIAVAELTYGLPVITLATTPVAAGVLTFVVAAVRIWLRSGKPKTIFYLCPNSECPRPERFIALKWSAVPLYRKQKGCPDCGTTLIKTCQQGKHFIVSPIPEKPDQAPKLDGFCPFCNPSIPQTKRVYLAK